VAQPASARLTVRVTPRAGRDEIGDFRDNVLLVKLKSPPVNGAANESLIALLAHRLGVAKGRVFVVRGSSSRLKVVEVQGLEHDQVMARLAADD
jgi:uncharacterized protein (TIGR00251 family)